MVGDKCACIRRTSKQVECLWPWSLVDLVRIINLMFERKITWKYVFSTENKRNST